MPGFYEITFLPEGKVQRFAGSRGNYYEFEDGSHLDIHTAPVWCHHCGDITHGEQIKALEEIDKELADLDDPNSELYRFTMMSLLPELDAISPRESFRLERIEETRKRRQWNERRSSPPKCIHCGSTNITLLPMEQPILIPPGPISVVVRFAGMCSTDFNEWFFTPEGDRIPRDTKPTHWHHPQLDNSPGAVRRFLRRITKGKIE
jgi:hypothetical protein